MAVANILEKFNIFNDPELALSGLEGPSGLVDDPPFFQIHFVARNPYYTQDMDGNFQLARKYRRQFNKLKAEFAKKMKPMFDDPENLLPPKFKSLDETVQAVKTLEAMIQSQLVVPDKLELETIQIMGNWDVYVEPKTKLAKEWDEKLNQEMEAYVHGKFSNDEDDLWY